MCVNMQCVGVAGICKMATSLDSRPHFLGKRRPGIHCTRMRVHYPKKGVIRVFVSKINTYTIITEYIL